MQPNQEDGKNSRMQVPGKVLVTRSTARYAGFPLAPAEGLRPSADAFFALRANKYIFMSVLAQILVIFGDQ